MRSAIYGFTAGSKQTPAFSGRERRHYLKPIVSGNAPGIQLLNFLLGRRFFGESGFSPCQPRYPPSRKAIPTNAAVGSPTVLLSPVTSDGRTSSDALGAPNDESVSKQAVHACLHDWAVAGIPGKLSTGARDMSSAPDFASTPGAAGPAGTTGVTGTMGSKSIVLSLSERTAFSPPP